MSKFEIIAILLRVFDKKDQKGDIGRKIGGKGKKKEENVEKLLKRSEIRYKGVRKNYISYQI